MSHLHDTFVVSTSCRRPTYIAFSRLFKCLPRARDNQFVRTSRRHDTLAVSTTHWRLAYCASIRPFNCLPHVRHQTVRVSRRHETSPSPRSVDIRPTIVQPQQYRQHCGRTYSAGGETMRPTATLVIVLLNPAEWREGYCWLCAA